MMMRNQMQDGENMGLARDVGSYGDGNTATANTKSRVHDITPAPSMCLAPELSEDFEVGEFLGSGGMGRVYKARDRKLRRDVAIKCVSTSGVATDTALADEAQLMARISHSNVATVHDVRVHGDTAYIVSQYIDGQSLAEIAKPVPWNRARNWGRQLALGLAAAHGRDVLHRDIKPANVMIDAQTREAILIDFGVGKLMTNAAETLSRAKGGGPIETAPGGRPGTRRYQAPELWQGERANVRSDIYALGLVLRELCTGEMPPAPDDAAAQAPLYLDRDDIDARFVRIVNRCLAIDPAERYGSANELAQALAEHANAPVVMRNPYRGLEMFCEQHQSMFFGREAEIAQVVERIQIHPLVLLVGDSGVGKSSLARAGVLPRLSSNHLPSHICWRTCRMVPGRRPLATLVQQLLQPLSTGAEVAMDGMPNVRSPSEWQHKAIADAFAHNLVASLESQEIRLVLLVDQLEELVTVSEAAQAQAAQILLAAIIEAPGDHIRILATVRSDYLNAVGDMAELGPHIQDRIYLVRSLGSAAIRDAIVEPAHKVGIRFESDELVRRLQDAVAGSGAGMPLLQFVLAGLWERRDIDGDRITKASLDSIGDIAGALARHADDVIKTLSGKGQGDIARRILIRLVSLSHRTRIRCTREDLVGADAGARDVLDSLVKQRLVIAHDGEGEGGYSLAHEALLSEWPQLGQWLDSERDLTELKGDLADAVAVWERGGRMGDNLGSRHLVREAERIPGADLSPAEATFLAASQSHLRRKRWGAWAAAATVMGLIFAIYGYHWYQISLRVDAHMAQARGHLDRAGQLHAAYDNANGQTQAALQAGEDGWSSSWRAALALYPQVRAAYGHAIQEAEAGFTLDPGRGHTITLLARVLDGRARLAAATGRRQEHAEIVQRLRLLEPAYAARWPASVPVTVRTVPAGADSEIWRYVWHREAPFELQRVDGACTRDTCELAPGSYLVIVRASEGYAEVRYPVVVDARAGTNLTIARPRAKDIPAGFVFVPAGSYLRGYGQVPQDEEYRTWHEAPPLHARYLDAFLIGTHEVTFRAWLAFVDACAGGGCAGIEAPKRRIEAKFDALHLVVDRAGDGAWQIAWQPSSNGPMYRASADGPIVYQGRNTRGSQMWLDTPVSGVSWHDVQGYLAWLRNHHGIASADLCTEAQWERAARGADARLYPHGNGMLRTGANGGEHADANIDITYGQVPTAFGPDVVGSYAESMSPFGVLDMPGNIAELTRPEASDGAAAGDSATGPAMVAVRGGAFYYATVDSRVFNRWKITAHQRLPMVGFRVCALAPKDV